MNTLKAVERACELVGAGRGRDEGRGWCAGCDRTRTPTPSP
ncbi:MAG: hypothetical protein ACLSHO_10980 [Dysosmobacter sp.]